jgi:hypothetical protein
MRADAFTRGFLARVVRRPRWFVWLLRPVTVRPVLHRLGIMPLQDLHLRPAEEWLRDARQGLSDPVAGDAVASSLLEELAAAGRTTLADVRGQRVSRLLRWRYHAALVRYHGPEALIGEARRFAERRVVERARQYLEDISAWMRSGGSVYSAPEGKLSPDGRISPIKSGFHRVLHAASDQARVVPIVITYDFMSTGRSRLFIDLAPALEGVAAMPRGELDQRLRTAWLRAARFTCTQLATSFVVAASHDHPQFTEVELAMAVMAQARELAAEKRHVDRRLVTRRGARRRVRRYLAFAERTGAVARAPRGLWTALPFDPAVRVLPGDPGYRVAPLAYAWNELQEMLSVASAMPASQSESLTA